MSKIWTALCATIIGLGLMWPALADAQSPGTVPIQTAEDIVLGKADAPVTIFEYASLTCPHCARFDKNILPQVKKEWLDTGKAKLIYRDFPLDGTALKASQIARCAPADRFYGFVDVLFAQQDVWGKPGQDPIPALQRIAKLGGISEERVKECLADDKLQSMIVSQAFQAEKQYGVQSTPTFFINGKKVVGEPNSYEEFAKALAAAAPKS